MTVRLVAGLCPSWRYGEARYTASRPELHEQDSYSYVLASVYIGAADEAELTARFEQVVAALPFEVEDIG